MPEELNEFLQPVNAPINQVSFTSGYDFNSSIERGAVSSRALQGASVTSIKIGDAQITNAKVVTIDANKILAGTITVALNLGTASGGSIVLDGANKRITISDGTTDRVLLGYQSGGF